MDVNTLLHLVAVVEAGSLAEAARRTGVPKSTLSRKLRELEEDLGARLLQRNSRQIGLTEAGRRLLEHAHDVARSVDAAARDVRTQSSAALGPLRVTASVSLGERIILPLLLRFMCEHPGVQLELILDASTHDLIAERLDVAIRIGTPDPRSAVIARRLAETALYLFASPAYLEEHGPPADVEALRHHEGILYRPDPRPGAFVLEGPDGELHRVTPRQRLLVNSHIVARDAVIDGLGIGCLAAPFIHDAVAAGELVRVLPEWRTPRMWVYAAFPDPDLSGAARAFVEFIAAHFDATGLLLEPDVA